MYDANVIYHVFNRSINFEPLFRSEDNYAYFLRKVKRTLSPYAEMLCYCLMPDHFHFLLKPTELGCGPSPSLKIAGKGEDEIQQHQQFLSHQFKVLLSSYAKAYNKRYNRRGSLFQAHTKAKPGYTDFLPEELAPDNGEPFTRYVLYLQTCFHYIHDNPVKAHLAAQPTDWPFSSARDYAGLSDSGICNYALTARLLNIHRQEL